MSLYTLHSHLLHTQYLIFVWKCSLLTILAIYRETKPIFQIKGCLAHSHLMKNILFAIVMLISHHLLASSSIFFLLPYFRNQHFQSLFFIVFQICPFYFTFLLKITFNLTQYLFNFSLFILLIVLALNFHFS